MQKVYDNTNSILMVKTICSNGYYLIDYHIFGNHWSIWLPKLWQPIVIVQSRLSFIMVSQLMVTKIKKFPFTWIHIEKICHSSYPPINLNHPSTQMWKSSQSAILISPYIKSLANGLAHAFTRIVKSALISHSWTITRAHLTSNL